MPKSGAHAPTSSCDNPTVCTPNKPAQFHVKKPRIESGSSLRSKRFRGAKSEETGFSAFCPRKNGARAKIRTKVTKTQLR